MQDPLFFFFPILETRFLHLFPKRKLIHNDCDRFLSLMDSMIEEKRRILDDGKSDEVFVSSASGKFAQNDEQEKDILTLLLESEKSCQDDNTFMTNDEIKSNLCLFFSAGNSSKLFPHQKMLSYNTIFKYAYRA
jgi:cytochrome P450